jgi:hypothetical protein
MLCRVCSSRVATGVLILYPGWVRTRMGGEGTNLMPSESVKGMRSLVERFTLENSGRFFR